MKLFVESRRNSLILVLAFALLVSAAWIATSRDDAAAASATPVVYIVTGENFPDALGVGPASALQRGPILMVTRDSIPGPTSRELSRLRPDRIVVVGGTAVIASSVESQLRAWAPVSRIAGANRYETAALVSQAAFPAPPFGSGPTAAGADGDFINTESVPLKLSDQVITELGSMNVVVPADGGVLSLTTQTSVDSPLGGSGGYMLLWQAIDDSCASRVGTSFGTSFIAADGTEIVSQTRAFNVDGGTYTLRSCTESFPLIASEKTEISEARIAAIWTPSTMGGVVNQNAQFGDDANLSNLESRVRARVEAIRAAASE